MEDAGAIRALADDFMVARWMTRRFPHPYTQQDADKWVALATTDNSGHHFGIEVDGELAGGAGLEPLDGERSGTALIGYWLGRAYWGRGIGTDAVRSLSDNALGTFRRLEASVFAQNVASAKILENCGFVLEGTLQALYIDRSGAVCDAFLFARLATPTI